jgi:malate dehydrogenase
MERKDLLVANAQIFTAQGKALDQAASRDVKVLVVGNPANTNAYIAMKSAPSCRKELHRDDAAGPQPRAVAARRQDRQAGRVDREAGRLGQPFADHVPGYPLRHDRRQPAKPMIDDAWYRDTFIPTVGKRGAAIIEARGLSSAASAANAAIDHVRDWVLGSNGRWVTMGVASDGSYGIPEEIVYGVPCTCAGGKYEVVKGLEIDDFSRGKMDNTLKELLEERDGVKHLLG